MKDIWLKCESCGIAKPDVRLRNNAYVQDVGNQPDAKHTVCDDCDHENRMDI